MTATTIEAIETLERDPAFCRIRVGSRFHGPIRRDDAERLGLRAGGRWSAARARAVDALVGAARARRAALTALARSAVSRERLEERLVARGHDAVMVTAALDELERDGWLDDRRSAEERARTVERRTTLARPALEALLDDEGFRRDARGAVTGATGSASEFERALAEASRERLRSRGAAAVVRHLARRGFDFDTIGSVVERLGWSTDDLSKAS